MDEKMTGFLIMVGAVIAALVVWDLIGATVGKAISPTTG